ncbi:MAG: hypothetical protein GX639_00825 [Fibrobacter sp.]|nr:hypothetical protein [Fibrobacter sp.]
MKILTEDALLVCGHKAGKVNIFGSQNLVTINNRQILVDNDPESKSISGCPNIGMGIKPCTNTLPVMQGYCSYIKINGRRLCLDIVEGLTDGTPPGTVKYSVQTPGQSFVEVR